MPLLLTNMLAVPADDWNLVLDCLAAARQPQQDEACGTGPGAGHAHGGFVAGSCPLQALHVRARHPPGGGELHTDALVSQERICFMKRS